ncbi:MAG: hypothetical protein QM666_00420 [Acinetobacter sp.]
MENSKCMYDVGNEMLEKAGAYFSVKISNKREIHKKIMVMTDLKIQSDVLRKEF